MIIKYSRGIDVSSALDTSEFTVRTAEVVFTSRPTAPAFGFVKIPSYRLPTTRMIPLLAGVSLRSRLNQEISSSLTFQRDILGSKLSERTCNDSTRRCTVRCDVRSDTHIAQFCDVLAALHHPALCFIFRGSIVWQSISAGDTSFRIINRQLTKPKRTMLYLRERFVPTRALENARGIPLERSLRFKRRVSLIARDSLELPMRVPEAATCYCKSAGKRKTHRRYTQGKRVSTRLAEYLFARPPVRGFVYGLCLRSLSQRLRETSS